MRLHAIPRPYDSLTESLLESPDMFSLARKRAGSYDVHSRGVKGVADMLGACFWERQAVGDVRFAAFPCLPVDFAAAGCGLVVAGHGLLKED